MLTHLLRALRLRNSLNPDHSAHPTGLVSYYAPVALPPADMVPCDGHAPRPYLNRFRGEPAISRLDWPFTPTHKSSERFSTHTGSGLHSVLPELHPAHG